MYLIYLNHSEYVSRQSSDKSDKSVSLFSFDHRLQIIIGICSLALVICEDYLSL